MVYMSLYSSRRPGILHHNMFQHVPTYSKAVRLPPPVTHQLLCCQASHAASSHPVRGSQQRCPSSSILPARRRSAKLNTDDVDDVHYTSSKQRPKKDPTGFKSSTLLISTTVTFVRQQTVSNERLNMLDRLQPKCRKHLEFCTAASLEPRISLMKWA